MEPIQMSTEEFKAMIGGSPPPSANPIRSAQIPFDCSKGIHDLTVAAGTVVRYCRRCAYQDRLTGVSSLNKQSLLQKQDFIDAVKIVGNKSLVIAGTAGFILLQTCVWTLQAMVILSQISAAIAKVVFPVFLGICLWCMLIAPRLLMILFRAGVFFFNIVMTIMTFGVYGIFWKRLGHRPSGVRRYRY